MPGEFVNVPEETDPDLLAQDIFNYLESRVPEWEPRDTELDTWIISAFARIMATLKDTASEARIAIFRYLGSEIFNIPPVEATRATATSTWTLIDALGHTIPAGTFIGVPTAGGELIAFETIEDIVVPVGTSKTGVGEVPIQAVEPGKEGGGLGALGTQCQLEDQYAWVKEDGILLHETTQGGTDAESDAEYLNRLVVEIRLWAPRPITPRNFADISRNIPGVGRALAINLYNPESKTYGHEKTITIVVEDGNGAAVSAKVKEELKAYLEVQREVNFVIFVIDPTFEQVDIKWEANHWEGFTAADVRERGNAALEEFLKANEWGLPPFGDKKLWYAREKVTINDIVSALGAVQGLKDVLSVEIRKHETGPYAATDLTLEGVAVLPKPGILTGTVV